MGSRLLEHLALSHTLRVAKAGPRLRQSGLTSRGHPLCSTSACSLEWAGLRPLGFCTGGEVEPNPNVPWSACQEAMALAL